MSAPREGPALRRFAVASIAAAVVTISLKLGAYWVTGSVGLLSDALESLVNLAAAVAALAALWVAAMPADEEHAYGHTKAEYLSSGFEGALILVAAGSIAWAAGDRLRHPQPIHSPWLGVGAAAVATVVNLAVALILLRAGRRFNSITLEADAHHLFADVITTIGVMIGVGATALTGRHWLDPVVAIVVAANIVRIGLDLLRRSALGLLDTALPIEMRAEITRILEQERGQGVDFHAIRTREAGARRFVSFHILVPGDWTVQRGHDLLEHIEDEIRAAIPRCTVFTHLEPLEDPASFEDTRLERGKRQG
jgi:cation diffusion facilitator family transporter